MNDIKKLFRQQSEIMKTVIDRVNDQAKQIANLKGQLEIYDNITDEYAERIAELEKQLEFIMKNTVMFTRKKNGMPDFSVTTLETFYRQMKNP